MTVTAPIDDIAAADELTVGSRVKFVDPTRRVHLALVTAVHGPTSPAKMIEQIKHQFKTAREDAEKRGAPIPAWASEEQEAANLGRNWMIPSINLVYVEGDESKTDSYGRQIARATSVPHESTQTAAGYKYTF